MAFATSALTPSAGPAVPVLTAARDLAAGTVLGPDDVAAVPLPTSLVPAGALGTAQQAVGRLLAGPVRRGEPMTDVRLAGPALLAGAPPGLVAVAVRVADGSAAVVSPGDRVDVLSVGGGGRTGASGETGGGSQIVAPDALVLAVTGLPDPALVAAGPTAADQPLILLAASPSTGLRLAEATATGHLALLLRPHP